uniref:C2 domain-containing protein n=1 Tax=Meloidogyne javanica TaxID=6303 RepID=A0A915N9A8_MELJA
MSRVRKCRSIRTPYEKDILHPFISHWTIGEPEDVSFGCQIAGTDPSFGFARICDEASAKRIFQEENVKQNILVREGGL